MAAELVVAVVAELVAAAAFNKSKNSRSNPRWQTLAKLGNPAWPNRPSPGFAPLFPVPGESRPLQTQTKPAKPVQPGEAWDERPDPAECRLHPSCCQFLSFFVAVAGCFE